MKGINLSILVLFLSIPTAYGAKLVFPKAGLKVNPDILDSLSMNKTSSAIHTGGLELIEKKISLLGTHYYYQQKENGFPVEGAGLVLSSDKAGNIFKIYNTTKKLGAEKMNTFPLLSSDQAIRMAWEELAVDGELIELPKVKLLFKQSEKRELIYRVTLSTSSPQGHWDVEINAVNGELISIADHGIARKKRLFAYAAIISRDKRIAGNFEKALSNFYKEDDKRQVEKLTAMKATGFATVFDPSPVVTLNRTDLEDTMGASVFEDAYKRVEFKDIDEVNGVYHLRGKRVKLIDFESPRIDPTTNDNGDWDFRRKDPGFNDAMTYYHLDQSMRYIESLGYKGNKEIFKKAIEVDANGLDGADNSHYIPSSRRLAFGHGCVDDNEDTDVILHELGHAINDHINPHWGGGDTGAIGEGFGDYWAGSYAYSKADGRAFSQSNWVFKWDGHNECWDGRVLNAYSTRYEHGTSYFAHSDLDGGVSDELWSTPTYQAFVELFDRGVEREVMDKIILESQFGMGYSIKMRDLARSIVKTAKALYPKEDYADIYKKHFKVHNILE